eukprot:1186763-Prorocentrum_minimum.AAC.2
MDDRGPRTEDRVHNQQCVRSASGNLRRVLKEFVKNCVLMGLFINMCASLPNKAHYGDDEILRERRSSFSKLRVKRKVVLPVRLTHWRSRLAVLNLGLHRKRRNVGIDSITCVAAFYTARITDEDVCTYVAEGTTYKLWGAAICDSDVDGGTVIGRPAQSKSNTQSLEWVTSIHARTRVP